MSKKYSKLKGKRFVKVPVLHESPTHIPLTYHDLIVYGYLTYRSRKVQGATQAGIATFLALDQLRTVPKIRDRLLAHGLIQRRGKLFALAPAGPNRKWFRYLKDDKPNWWDQFIYDRTYIPTPKARKFGLTAKTNALYWRLVRLAKAVERLPQHFAISPTVGSTPRKLNKAYLAKGLRFDPNTIASGLSTLEKLKLIRIAKLGNNYFGVGILPLTDEQQAWWCDAERATEVVGMQELFGISSPVVPKEAPSESPRLRAMIRHGVPTSLVKEILAASEKLVISDQEWMDIVEQCAQKHVRTSEERKTQGHSAVPHPGHLIRYAFRKLLQQQEEQRRHADSEPVHAEEMFAIEAMRRQNFPDEAIELLRQIVRTQSVKDDEIAVPIELGWDQVQTELDRSNGDFEKFQRLIAKRLYRPSSVVPPEELPVVKEPNATPSPKPLEIYAGRELHDYVRVELAESGRLEDRIADACFGHVGNTHDAMALTHTIILETLNRLGCTKRRRASREEFCAAADAILTSNGMKPVFGANIPSHALPNGY